MNDMMVILGKVSPLSAFFLVIGLYLFLLGCNAKIPPKIFQGKVSILILSVIVLLFAGSGIALTTLAPSIQKLVLDEILAQVHPPTQIGDKMRIEDVVIEGERIVYKISVNASPAETHALVDQLKQNIPQACEQSDFLLALQRGVSVESRFTDAAGTQLEPIIIAPTDCNFKK